MFLHIDGCYLVLYHFRYKPAWLIASLANDDECSLCSRLVVRQIFKSSTMSNRNHYVNGEH